MKLGDAWELGAWDAVETRERLRRGEVSAREVIEAAILRAEDAAVLGALVTATPDRALAAAATSPEQQRGPLSPLSGVPTAIKDLCRVAGVPTSFGTASARGYVPTRSDPTAITLERAGLVSIGKSATPELGMTATTEPLAFGPCRNPWAPSRTPGGSSGGAAALVASGVVPIAHGSDGGGSIRIPAACCGLVGLKPSRRRFDMPGSDLLPVNVAVEGALTRTVRDTVAFWEAVEQVAPPRRIAPIGKVAPAPSRRLRIGVFTSAPRGSAVDPEVAAGAREAAALCARLGHVVEEIPCPFEGRAVDDFVRFWGFTAFAQVRSGRLLITRDFDAARLEPYTTALVRHFTDHVAASVAATWRVRGVARAWAELTRRYDVVLSPTLGQLPPELGHLRTDVPFEIALPRLLEFTPHTCLINAAGAPAVSLPLARSAAGLPIGVQLAAAHGEDRLLLELASELEAAAPWPRLAPRESWWKSEG